ncbi:MAG: DsrE/DsrF/DrsH-like family protein [Flavobacteriaceae bacterium]|jgi:peroxiredoxin family protein|nr:DsrE/DsrF/DrsH-like family protein [Flavobacteriaceae bacterium]
METKIEVSPLADLDPNLKPIEKVMVIISKGTLEDIYPGLILANGARMEGIEAEIFFTFFGLEAVNKKTVDKIHVATVGNPAMHMPTMIGGLPGMEALATKMMKSKMEKLDIPPIMEFIEILSASGCRLWACKLAMEMFDLSKNDLVPEVEGVLTVGDFYSRAAGEGTQIIYT